MRVPRQMKRNKATFRILCVGSIGRFGARSPETRDGDSFGLS